MDFTETDEQRLWRQTVHDFCAQELKPQAAEMDSKAQFNAEAVRKMGPLGLLGMNIPEDYGGAGIGAVSGTMALEELGWACGGTALSVAAHNGLCCAAIAAFGDESQRQRWLPTLASGEKGLGALALTEPGAGSDLAGGVRTRAELEGGEWVVTGQKAWITNASLAPVIVTLCRTASEDDSHSFSLILIPAGSEGLHIHSAEKKMGTRASPTHAISYEGVRVPRESVLGDPGQGLPQTLQVLDGGRVGVGAIALGLARSALEEAVRYAGERRAFGRRLSEHEALQFMLADAGTQIEAARLLVRYAAWRKDQRLKFTQEAAMAKLFATEMAESVCRDAIQVFGAYGYSVEYPVERIYRDARLMTIGEGTSEIQRVVIARGVLGIS